MHKPEAKKALKASIPGLLLKQPRAFPEERDGLFAQRTGATWASYLK